MAIFPSSRSSHDGTLANRLAAFDVMILSAWCGLLSGELELAARLAPTFVGSPRLQQITRHFIWLVPVVDLLLFLTLGSLLIGVTWLWPSRTRSWAPRVIITLTLLPSLALIGPRIYVEAWFLVALGAASLISPILERASHRFRRWMLLSLPILGALVAAQAGSLLVGDQIKHWREAARTLPPAGSPNVLLIVLDTVRADHLGFDNYNRPTTPNLDRLAQYAIRFDNARATAPWTLPSHASFFTGRWPHELGARWLAPLEDRFPTLAGYLGSHGYATAGFVSNAGYCSYETGLNRGFTHYEDYVLEHPRSLRTARLVDAAVKLFGNLTAPFDRGWMHQLRSTVADWFFSEERKSAETVNHDFLSWLKHRPEPARPFFVFLNYLDTHTPYLLPAGGRHQFGLDPRTKPEYLEILSDWAVLNKQKLPPRFQVLARDAYDNCLAYLDEQIGALFDQLKRQGTLENTVVIITSDHGEGLGEHDLFMHGESLYRTEIRVPLLIIPASRRPSEVVVHQTVSLRDLPATIVDLLGLQSGSPFPGTSLAGLWAASTSARLPSGIHEVRSELASANPSDPNKGRSPVYRGPMVALAQGESVYILNQASGSEELYNDRADPGELNNLAGDIAMQPLLRAFREQLRKSPALSVTNAADQPGSVTRRNPRLP